MLEKLRQVGVPPKATIQWLKTIGFTSSNDTSLLGVLKAVGLVDGSNVPTGIWSSYRGVHHKKVLGDAIRAGYAELFAVYPDAWQRSSSDLEHVFSTSSNAGQQVIAKTVGTFKALCENAEFGTVEQQPTPVVQTGPMHTPVSQQLINPMQAVAGTTPTPSIHIDIQIHISPEASTDQIDQVFKSMAKHLYGERDTR